MYSARNQSVGVYTIHHVHRQAAPAVAQQHVKDLRCARHPVSQPSSLRAICGLRRAREWLESRPPGCSRSQTEPGQPAGSHRIGPEEGRTSPRTVCAVCSARGFLAPAVPRTASRGAAVSQRKACPAPSGGVKWRTLSGVRRSRFVFSGPGLATEDSMWPDHGHSDHRQKGGFSVRTT